MKQFVVHDESGKIIRWGWCQDDDFTLQAILPGESVIEGHCYDPSTQYVDNGVVITPQAEE